MALIICSECGKEFSDKASACPNCGCPIEAICNSASNDTDMQNLCADETDSVTTANKVWDSVQTGIQSAIEKNRNAIKATKQIGPVQIDEKP